MEDITSKSVLGHRKRVKEKFLGQYSLDNEYQDYELLELLLFYSVPRKDVKPIAKQLITKFGSLRALLDTSIEELRANPQISENTCTLIKLLKATHIHSLKAKVQNKIILSNWKELMDFCFVKLSNEKKEFMQVIFLNTKYAIIKEEIMQSGTVDYADIHPREIIKRALELAATSIVLIHNHPSGDSAPSKTDIDFTRNLAKTLFSLGIELLDHIILGHQNYTSLKQLRLID